MTILLHSRCVQWLEKAVDNRVQALRCKAFKMAVNFSPMHYNEGVRLFLWERRKPRSTHIIRCPSLPGLQEGQLRG
ncbi:hypothetical protein [uncultured Stenotrophomonas sp.]|uniref:hypothetical protein n=1 Tax=uncultured Stenotrophomonas sp. TaxID=165438 RepID=UPI0025D48BC1|nr:hypothetical protein [uncultured Stenotrophomonas sp.]